ncbi:MAG TPA: hypothetical protein VFQ44_25005 [Streptosporangiaceae bacterium]|nr:hypothetical protein [Streptosporangiaceae bacterium]
MIGWVGGSYVADGRLAARKAGQARSRSVRADILEGLRWLAKQRLLRTMAILIGLLNVTLTGAMALLVLLARERLRAGSVGYGLLSPARRLARSLVQP